KMLQFFETSSNLGRLPVQSPAKGLAMCRRILLSAFLVIPAICLLAADTAQDATSYLGHVTTDKPIYRIGEQAFIRAVVLSANDHKPFADAQQTNAVLTVTGPKGETLATSYSQIQDSVAGFQWLVPDEA